MRFGLAAAIAIFIFSSIVFAACPGGNLPGEIRQETGVLNGGKFSIYYPQTSPVVKYGVNEIKIDSLNGLVLAWNEDNPGGDGKVSLAVCGTAAIGTDKKLVVKVLAIRPNDQGKLVADLSFTRLSSLPTCSDSGSSLYEKGNIKAFSTTGAYEEKFDYCTSDGKVAEYWCSGKYKAISTYDCPQGYTCTSGACTAVKTTPTAKASACAVDYDGNGVVEQADVTPIANNYQKKASENNCKLGVKSDFSCAVFDGNGDGIVDAKDSDLIGSAYLQNCDYAKFDFDGDGKIEWDSNYYYGSDSYHINQYLNPSTARTYSTEKTCGSDSTCSKYDANGDGKVSLDFSNPRNRDNNFLKRYDGKTVSPACSDSDGGKDTGVKGTVTKGTTRSIDACNTQMENYVNEYFCNNGNIATTAIPCGTGKTCSDGACKEVTRETPQVKQPDLQITSATWKKTTANIRENGLLYVTVKNKGNAEAKGFYLVIEAKGIYWNLIGCTLAAGYTGQHLITLAPGAKETKTFGVVCSTAGNKEFTVTADFLNRVAESDETNNIANAAFTVTPAQQTQAPAFAITEAHYNDNQKRIYATANKAASCSFQIGSFAKRDLPCLTTACLSFQRTLDSTPSADVTVTCSAKDGSGSASKTITVSTTAACTDSDASLTLERRLATRGSCTDATGTYWDYTPAGSTTKVVDYYCSPTSAAPSAQKCSGATTYNCPSGTVSQTGRCVSPTVSSPVDAITGTGTTAITQGCKDSDGGIVYNRKGTVTKYNANAITSTSTLAETKTDVCSAGLLTEYYCTSAGGIGSRYIYCGYLGCSNGACNQLTATTVTSSYPAQTSGTGTIGGISGGVTDAEADVVSIGNEIVGWLNKMFFG